MSAETEMKGMRITFFSWNRVVTKYFIHFHEFFLISRGAQCGGDGLSIVSPSNRRKVPTARRSRRCRRRRENVSVCSGLSTGHEKHDGRFAQKACVTSDDIFMWCHKLSLPIQKRSIFYHLGIQSCLSAFGGSLNSTPTDWIVAPLAATRRRWLPSSSSLSRSRSLLEHFLLFT